MPATFNGIGTTFYGQSSFRTDESFVTTKWFVLGFFPLAPLGSVRVRQLDSSGIPFLSRSTGYEILEELPIDWLQVLRTWSYTLLLIFVFVRVSASNSSPLAKFILVTLGVLLPFAVRALGKRINPPSEPPVNLSRRRS